MTTDRTLPLATTAEMIGIKAGTLRRWCAYHSAHLSATANPPTGQPRRFTNRDVEILRYVQDLRSQGVTVDSINSQLGLLTFPEIDTTGQNEEQLEADSTELAAVGPQEGLHDVAAIMLLLSNHQAQIEALQQARDNDRYSSIDTITAIGMGLCMGLLFAAIAIGLAWLYGGG